MIPIPFKDIHIYLALLYSFYLKIHCNAFKFFGLTCLFQVDTSSQAECRKSKNFILRYSILGAFERQSQKCLLEECSLRVMLPSSRPPQESSEEIVSARLLDRVHRNSFLYRGGAKAWPAVSKRMQKGFKVKQVSHRNQEFVRKSKKRLQAHRWLIAAGPSCRNGFLPP